MCNYKSCKYKLAGDVDWEIDIQSTNCDSWDTCKKVN